MPHDPPIAVVPEAAVVALEAVLEEEEWVVTAVEETTNQEAEETNHQIEEDSDWLNSYDVIYPSCAGALRMHFIFFSAL